MKLSFGYDYIRPVKSPASHIIEQILVIELSESYVALRSPKKVRTLRDINLRSCYPYISEIPIIKDDHYLIWRGLIVIIVQVLEGKVEINARRRIVIFFRRKELNGDSIGGCIQIFWIRILYGEEECVYKIEQHAILGNATYWIKVVKLSQGRASEEVTRTLPIEIKSASCNLLGIICICIVECEIIVVFFLKKANRRVLNL